MFLFWCYIPSNATARDIKVLIDIAAVNDQCFILHRLSLKMLSSLLALIFGYDFSDQ